MKKWIHKYQYLQEELKDIKKQNSGYQKEMMLQYEDTTPEEVTPKQKILPSRIPDNPGKPLFKVISKVLHPDKGGDEKMFAKASDLYREKNTLGLYLMALEYNLEVEDLICGDMIESFEECCNQKEKEINQIKTTVSWTWGTLSQNPKQKELFDKYLEETHQLKKKTP